MNKELRQDSDGRKSNCVHISGVLKMKQTSWTMHSTRSTFSLLGWGRISMCGMSPELFVQQERPTDHWISRPPIQLLGRWILDSGATYALQDTSIHLVCVGIKLLNCVMFWPTTGHFWTIFSISVMSPNSSNTQFQVPKAVGLYALGNLGTTRSFTLIVLEKDILLCDSDTSQLWFSNL